MTSRQVEIAAESYVASLLAQTGYDVMVQYGSNQPEYDLVAIKDKRILLVSVKGSQDGGWPLAASYIKQSGGDYGKALNSWLEKRRDDIIFILVQFFNVNLGDSPRVYIAKPNEIVSYMKSQCGGKGHGALREDYKKHYPKSKYDDKIPVEWRFSQTRIDSI